MNKTKIIEMNELEKQENDNTDQLGKIGNQNMEAKTEYKKLKATKVTSSSPLSPQDKMILNDVKNGRPMDRICAQYMVNRQYVEKLTNENV